MPRVDVVVESEIVETPRVIQISGMFDAPIREKIIQEWHANVDIETKDWNVGLIVGPSGSGKTQIAESIFGREVVRREFSWTSPSMIDDFPKSVSVREIADVMSSVGFSTIPSWMKPFRVLSNGEQFRATVARKIIESSDPIVIDEFSSVVDRQVAKIACHAVQKAIRKRNRKFVAVSCHDDIENWLQPDWVFEPTSCSLRWRSLRRRPELNVLVSPVKFDAWQLFAPFHYLSADLSRSARCFCLFVDEKPAAFVGVLHRAISAPGRRKRIWGVSRLVTHPDYQGLGLAFVLLEKIGGSYAVMGERFCMYPAHPSLVNSFERSRQWVRKKQAGTFSANSLSSGMSMCSGQLGGRSCGVYEYVGKPLDHASAAMLLGKF